MYHVLTLADGTTWAYRCPAKAAAMHAAKAGSSLQVWQDADYLRHYAEKNAAVLPPALAKALAKRMQG